MAKCLHCRFRREIHCPALQVDSATTSGGIVRIRLKKLATGSFYGNVSPSASVSRDGYSTGLALPFSAQCGRLGIYNYVSGFYGENETLDRTYSEFRNSGYSLDSEDRGRITSRNIRELLSLVYKINVKGARR